MQIPVEVKKQVDWFFDNLNDIYESPFTKGLTVLVSLELYAPISFAYSPDPSSENYPRNSS